MRILNAVLLCCMAHLVIAAPKKKPSKEFYDLFTIELPTTVGWAYAINVKNAVAPTANGLGQIHNVAAGKSSNSIFGIGINNHSSILGISWKNKIGIEVGLGMFEKSTNYSFATTYLQSQCPNLYISGVAPYSTSYSSYHFSKQTLTVSQWFYSAWYYGFYTSFNWKSIFLQPHLNFAFSDNSLFGSGGGNDSLYSIYKERGSNRYTTSTLTSRISANKVAYSTQLMLFYRSPPDKERHHIAFELGVKTQLNIIPFGYNTTIVNKDFGGQTNSYKQAGSGTFTSFSFGLFLGASLTKEK